MGQQEGSQPRLLSPFLWLGSRILVKVLKACWACRWWRLLLDEAQKAGTGRVAAMTEQISACNRWLVTGTPIGRQGK